MNCLQKFRKAKQNTNELTKQPNNQTKGNKQINNQKNKPGKLYSKLFRVDFHKVMESILV